MVTRDTAAVVLATDHGAPLSLTPDDIDFLDAIYRGDPTAADAERAVTLADNSLATLDRFLASRAQPEASEPSESPFPLRRAGRRRLMLKALT